MTNGALERLVTGAGFASFLYTLSPSNKQAGAVKRITLNVGAKYPNILRRSLDKLTAIMEAEFGFVIIDKATEANPHTTPDYIRALGFNETMQEAAQREHESLLKAIKAHETKTHNPDYTKAGLYDTIERVETADSSDGAALNVKRHKVDGTLELGGMLHASITLKRSHLPYREPKSRPLTIARNIIRKRLPRSKWRSLAIENVAVIKRAGEHLIFAPVKPVKEFGDWGKQAVADAYTTALA